MRYTIVTETYLPEVNGVALTVRGLELGLRLRGHQVHVVRPRQDAGDLGSAPDTTLLPGARLPRYPGLRLGLPAHRRLQQAWTTTPPDAIYVATEGPLGWSALRTARRLGIPVATGFHTRFDHYMRDYAMPWLQPVALRWMRRFHNKAPGDLVPTQQLADELRGRGFERVVRLARAVDASQFSPTLRDAGLRQTWQADAGAPVVVHVGRIAAEKNLPVLVRAFRAIQQQQPGARMVWVGDGPEREALAARHPDFVFCGVQRGEDLARHFASADLFLFPSRSETFGNVTLEAMASGVATVAFDEGAAREHLQDGVHGALARDDAEFVEAAVRLAATDPALRAAMGARACQAMLLLQPEQVAADFDHLLSTLSTRTENPHAHAQAA